MVPSPTPKRDHGDPQSFRLRSAGNRRLVRAEGLEPSRTLRSNGFSYHFGFHRRHLSVRGLDYPFAISGAARLVSTPSPCGAWLGIAMLKGSPNLSSSASPVSRRALKFYLSPVRMPFRHARVAIHRFYPSCSAGGSIFIFVFGRRTLIAAASRIFFRWDA